MRARPPLCPVAHERPRPPNSRTLSRNPHPLGTPVISADPESQCGSCWQPPRPPASERFRIPSGAPFMINRTPVAPKRTARRRYVPLGEQLHAEWDITADSLAFSHPYVPMDDRLGFEWDVMAGLLAFFRPPCPSIMKAGRCQRNPHPLSGSAPTRDPRSGCRSREPVRILLATTPPRQHWVISQTVYTPRRALTVCE